VKINHSNYIHDRLIKFLQWLNRFLNTLWREADLLRNRAYRTRKGAHAAIFENIEVFYNCKRMHSTFGYLTPAEYEGSEAKKAA